MNKQAHVAIRVNPNLKKRCEEIEKKVRAHFGLEDVVEETAQEAAKSSKKASKEE